MNKRSYMLFVLIAGFAAMLSVGACRAQSDIAVKNIAWSQKMADSFLQRHLSFVTYDSGAPSAKWNYEQGLMLVALDRMWKSSGEQKYFDFVRKNLDQYIDKEGTIKTYKAEDYKLDDVGPGRALLSLYEATHQEKYKIAADKLGEQLKNQPRTSEGGFWHKKIYPNQMWLDGMFMAEPFYAMYAKTFNDKDSFNDIVNQFILAATHTYDAKTGLYFHGWDESKQERWANTETGCSPSLWSRSIGWYMMGLADMLDYLPVDHPKRNKLLEIYRNLADALMKFRDEKSSVWYQVVDQGDRNGNYLESSASCMFVYCFAKGVNEGYLDSRFSELADQSFQGIIAQFVRTGVAGMTDLNGTCRSAGLGGNPYRDGSFEYYISETPRNNDMKGIGSFLLAAIELEKKNTASMHKSQGGK